MSREELKKALLTIKKECKRNYNCDHCMTKDILGTPHCLDIEPLEWTFKEDKETINCDRCGKETTDHTAYVVNIGAVGLAGGVGGITTAGASQNILRDIQPTKYLCQECKGEIESFINNSTVKEDNKNVD